MDDEFVEDPAMDLDESESEEDSDDEDDDVIKEESEEDADDHSDDEQGPKTRPRVYLPNKPLKEGERLECDESVYLMRHEGKAGAPCLSFDILRDDLGENREAFPHTAFVVAGTQSPKNSDNAIVVIKMDNLVKTQKTSKESDDESDSDDSDNELSEAQKPVMYFSLLKHVGCVNRIRSTVIDGKTLAASWSSLARVSVWDLDEPIRNVEENKQLPKKVKREGYGAISKTSPPVYTFKGHNVEGYGLDWSPTMPGVLASGDCSRNIHVWLPQDNGSSWKVDIRPLVGHTQSVEDLQWSPTEQHVLASCSVDKSIRIWDTRANPYKANQLTLQNAHTSDVNVISWNKKEPFILSGGDDGYLHIWDLRKFETGTAVATFKHHTAPITTVEWHPSESTVFASGGADNQIALWDLSLEPDKEAGKDSEEDPEIPPQLLFIHQGQKDIKELHWHPQITSALMSTAATGFNIFRTISV